jgi:DNA-binding Xre family transcriptional regulator
LDFLTDSEEVQMIDIQIRQRCEERGITNPYQLQKAADLFPAMASRLFHHKFGQISIETLDKLCEALECDVSALLVRLPDKKKSGKE